MAQLTALRWTLVMMLATASVTGQTVAPGAFNPAYPYNTSDISYDTVLDLQTPWVCRWAQHVNGTNAFQSVLALTPCTWITAHWHPNGNEYNFVMQGELQYWLARPQLPPIYVNGTTKAGQFNIMPEGLLHTLYNPTCDWTVMHHSFDTAYPLFSFGGIQLFNATPTQWQEDTFTSPTPGLNSPDNIHSVNDACIKACGLDYKTTFVDSCPPAPPTLNFSLSRGN